jgi:hypothetical protein
MKIIFYSKKCEYSNKMLNFLEKYNLTNNFKLIDIDTSENTIPKEITVVPTIIDSSIDKPLKSKEAFEYLLNLKYFNIKTNNIEYKKHIPENPTIIEDKLASNHLYTNIYELSKEKSKTTELTESEIFYNNNKNNDISKQTTEMINARTSQNSKLSVLLRMKK